MVTAIRCSTEIVRHSICAYSANATLATYSMVRIMECKSPCDESIWGYTYATAMAEIQN